MSTALELALGVVFLPVVLSSAYLFVLTLLSGPERVPAPRRPTTRFRFVIPAHDEAAGIAATVKSVLSVDYPRDLYDVLVVADNCSDDTAALARAAGAEVLERRSDTERGKGYALHYAFDRLPENVTAAVVIDADTLVSPNLLVAFDARIAAGASAVQADYAVRNPDAAWRTRLIAIALGAFHVLRSRARERLSVSVGLRGNGMCFTTEVLRAVPHVAYSLVEDLEYGVRLAEAGVRVVYAGEAHVYGEMVTTSKAATSQRKRWEEGRALFRKANAVRLLRAGLAGNPVLLDIAFDVLVPPLSRIVVGTGLAFLLATIGAAVFGGFAGSLTTYGACLGAIALYVFRGWMLSGTGARGLATMALAPVYVAWKLTIRSEPKKAESPEWVRTRRESSGP
ncbi:MAG TPA: glycosyltransferase family 2 protein [Polyangiaceae bacterium]|nr:glycosyltransferase family 2 protein [Polyangiaceae bacterium]